MRIKNVSMRSFIACLLIGTVGWLTPGLAGAADGPFGVEIYVRGSFNGWGLDDPMTWNMGEEVYQAEIKLKGDFYEFKIGDADWSYADIGFADDGAVELGIPEPVQNVPFNNIFLYAPYTATYSFELDVSIPDAWTLLVDCVRGCGGRPGVMFQVHAGGPDACEAFGDKPGCDANFSLNAVLKGDWTVEGQYTDRFTNGDGFHAVIDCVFGNSWPGGGIAWVSGIITQGQMDGQDLAGLPVATLVMDNGRSQQDPPDQISLSFIGDPTPCYFAPYYPLFDVPQGQVTVK